MADRQTIQVWQHSRTEKAILVHTTSSNHEADKDGEWLPRSQITIIGSEIIKYPLPEGKDPMYQAVKGTMLTIELPAWLAKKLKGDFQP